MIGGTGNSPRGAAFILTAVLLACAMALPAAAQPGGNCCADLEERVAELEATTARKGNRRVSLTISGQVSTALMAWDDGRTSDVYVVDLADKNVTGTSFSFDGSAKISPSLTAGFQIVLGLASGARSHQVDQFDDDATKGESTVAIELASWYIDHKSIGQLRLGRINTASHGVTTVDLGGAGIVANANIGLWQRGFFVTNSDFVEDFTWNTLLGGTTINLSGLSRANALLYTTPTLGGFSLSAAWGEDDLWDVALRYAGEFSGFRIAAAIAYAHNVGGKDEIIQEVPYGSAIRPSQWKGSASVMHVMSGLYLTSAYVSQDNDRPDLADNTLWYLQGGISQNWIGLGKTVLYAEYARVRNGPTSISLYEPFPDVRSTAVMWGIGVVQHIDAAAMEVFLGYRNYDLSRCTFEGERCSPPANDFGAVMSGARIRF